MQRKPQTVFDELLVIRCQKGDKKALEILVKRWNRKLLKFAYQRVGDMEAAKDVTQESWISISKSIRSLNDPLKFGAWAYRITYSKSMDWLRSVSRRNSEKVTEEIITSDSEDNTEDIAKVLGKAISRLPDRQKVVLNLFYTEGYNIFQIGEILKIPHGTVKSRLFKAREQLKTLIKQYSHEYEN